MTTGTRKFGEFAWFNILTPQPDAACEFFAALLGWTFADIPGGHLVKAAGHDIGALFDTAGPNSPPGTRPMIGVMLKVSNADEVSKRVLALGGVARPAFDIADQGRMVVCEDPNGAQFDVWQPNKSQLTDVDSMVHGAPSWFETMTTDVARATTFYRELFGWTSEAGPLPPPNTAYTTFKLNGAPVAGLMAITPQMGDVRPHWGVYFTVSDTDVVVRGAERLGAVTCVTARDIEHVGRFAGFTSPQGVTFYVIAYPQ